LEIRTKILADATRPVCYLFGVQPNNDEVFKSIVGKWIGCYLTFQVCHWRV